jgi:SAM-dependent methyltransferase
MKGILWHSDEQTRVNQIKNPYARMVREHVFAMIEKHGGLSGNVLDIGSRNLFTEILEEEYNLNIDSTQGDLDTCKPTNKAYDWVIYSHVIEHQYNPLKTLLDIKLKPGGKLVIACPLKPRWITQNRCHFNEFDKRSFDLIRQRAGYTEIDTDRFMRIFSLSGIRPLLGSFHKRSVVSIWIIKN